MARSLFALVSSASSSSSTPSSLAHTTAMTSPQRQRKPRWWRSVPSSATATATTTAAAAASNGPRAASIVDANSELWRDVWGSVIALKAAMEPGPSSHRPAASGSASNDGTAVPRRCGPWARVVTPASAAPAHASSVGASWIYADRQQRYLRGCELVEVALVPEQQLLGFKIAEVRHAPVCMPRGRRLRCDLCWLRWVGWLLSAPLPNRQLAVVDAVALPRLSTWMGRRKYGLCFARSRSARFPEGRRHTGDRTTPHYCRPSAAGNSDDGTRSSLLTDISSKARPRTRLGWCSSAPPNALLG